MFVNLVSFSKASTCLERVFKKGPQPLQKASKINPNLSLVDFWCNSDLLKVKQSLLTFSMCWADSADDKLMVFHFSKKIGFDICCKLLPKEKICMKCQILFSGKKNKKKYLHVKRY